MRWYEDNQDIHFNSNAFSVTASEDPNIAAAATNDVANPSIAISAARGQSIMFKSCATSPGNDTHPC
jgi:hypothetical protein